MNTQELFELAILDAFGMLDPQESEAFERAFAAAPPAVQAQVRREQVRMTRMDELLPKVDPPPGLRALVLDRVRQEALREETAQQESELVDRRQHAGRAFVPSLMPSRRVSPLWRAAALGLATACVLLAGVSFVINQESAALRDAMQSDRLVKSLIDELGSKYVQSVLFDQDTKRAVFTPVAGGFRGQASVFYNAEWDRARLFAQGLPTAGGGRLRLAVVDENDQIVQVLSEFDSNGTLLAREIKPVPAQATRLAIFSTPQDGQTPPTLLGRCVVNDRPL